MKKAVRGLNSDGLLQIIYEGDEMQKQFYNKHPKQTNQKCSQCGWEISYSHTFEDMLSGKFSNEKNGSFTAVRTTPVRAAGMIPDVAVPVAQSLIWSIVVGLPSISVAMWMRWEWSAPLFIGATTILVSWISAMRRSEFSMVKTEEFSYEANERTEEAIVATPAAVAIKMEIVHEEGGLKTRMQLLELDDGISEGDFAEFLKHLLQGHSIARRNWAGKDKLFSRDQYDGIIEKLLLGSVIGPSASGGRSLTNGGRRALQHMEREGII